ncbi:hypothetical protein EJB05_57881, partial [Eragrostis curvula]
MDCSQEIVSGANAIGWAPARFAELKEKTDKVRKRDVVLSSALPWRRGGRVRRVGSRGAAGQRLPAGQLHQRVGGAGPKRSNHLDWAVFENELKWYWTEAQRGHLNYGDADRLLDFCDRAGKPVRGHCIFWAVDGAVQQWIKDIGGDRDQLMSVVLDRVPRPALPLRRPVPALRHAPRPLLPRPPRRHVAALMFREAARLDPGAKLFVNDYNVECANDPNATPERYMALIDDLRRGGAQVGGIGLQGHVSNPVGEVICDALDKLAAMDLPIWITELDVGEQDEALRADDLEVVLREAYAHPAVEGVIFWGIMQGHMWRRDGRAPQRRRHPQPGDRGLFDLRSEWMSNARGRMDAEGQFKFRGFHGTYVVELTTPAGTKMLKAFTIDKGDATARARHGQPLTIDDSSPTSIPIYLYI